MGKRGKRYKNFKKLVEENKTYTILDAIKKIKSGNLAKFDETLDISINLEIR